MRGDFASQITLADQQVLNGPTRSTRNRHLCEANDRPLTAQQVEAFWRVGYREEGCVDCRAERRAHQDSPNPKGSAMLSLGHDVVQEIGTHAVRLFVAVVLGGVLGIDRQLHGRWAGIRTHMMVSLGAAIFTIAAILIAPNESHEVTRVIQGVAAGVGFLGAGAILKLSTELEVKGLTTASSIWLAAALGTVAGLGEYALAAAAGLMSLLVLAILRPLTKTVRKSTKLSRDGSDDHLPEKEIP